MANVVGTKWGSNKLGTPGGTVTWSIAAAGTDISKFGVSTTKSVSGNSFLDYNYVKVIEDAFAEWSKYGDIEFKQVADKGGAAGIGMDADIRIFFGAIPGGTAGYAYYPSFWGSAIAGDILLDTIDRFNTDPDLFAAVVLHEIGHSLGLGHVAGESIMTASVQKIGLQEDDIEGIQTIYGAQDDEESGGGGTGTTNPPPPEPETEKPEPETEKPEPETDGTAGIRLTGSNGADYLDGKSGNDTLAGYDGNDRLSGLEGSDSIDGGGGNDTLNGGSGNDTLKGRTGDDRLRGHDGDDKIYGAHGDDDITGGSGNDIVNGGFGEDIINGGRGDDRIVGGTENDVFVFNNNHGNDIIYDFDATSRLEKIDLSSMSGFNRFTDVARVATQEGAHVLIDTGSNGEIVLRNVSLSDLDSSDFLF